MTRIELRARQGPPVRLDRLDREVAPDDLLALAVILREWCKRQRWKPQSVRICARDPRRGWLRYVTDDGSSLVKETAR